MSDRCRHSFFSKVKQESDTLLRCSPGFIRHPVHSSAADGPIRSHCIEKLLFSQGWRKSSDDNFEPWANRSDARGLPERALIRSSLGCRRRDGQDAVHCGGFARFCDYHWGHWRRHLGERSASQSLTDNSQLENKKLKCWCKYLVVTLRIVRC